jgi:hypothetical protein
MLRLHHRTPRRGACRTCLPTDWPARHPTRPAPPLPTLIPTSPTPPAPRRLSLVVPISGDSTGRSLVMCATLMELRPRLHVVKISKALGASMEVRVASPCQPLGWQLASA